MMRSGSGTSVLWKAQKIVRLHETNFVDWPLISKPDITIYELPEGKYEIILPNFTKKPPYKNSERLHALKNKKNTPDNTCIFAQEDVTKAKMAPCHSTIWPLNFRTQNSAFSR